MRFGDYTLVQHIGRGGMAEIYLAKRIGVRGFEKPLAVKKILSKHTSRPSFVEMFVEEAKLTSRLSHQNIVQIYELGAVEGDYFIAMEYVAGWDLLRILQKAAAKKKPVPAGVVLRVMADVLRGLDYAHKATGDDGKPLRIVHFDVSPSNVMVSVTGSVKVSDFGVARAAVGLGEGSANDRFRGKIAYMSPEQLEESTAIDHRSDVFSAGICLYEALTLKRLFRAQTDKQTMDNVRAAAVEPRLERHPEIPVPIKDILRRALAVRPVDRYATASDMADALETFLFDNRVRVTSRDVAEYLADLFEGEPTPGLAALAGPTREGSAATTGARGSFMGLSASRGLSEAQRGQPAEGGFFDADRAAGLVARLCSTRSTGALLLTRTPVRKELFFARGQLVYSRSNLDDEHLPVVLLAEKLVDEGRLRALVEHAREHGIGVEAAAMKLGIIDASGIVRAVTVQLERRVIELFRWKNGHYGFYPGVEPPASALRLDVDALGLLGKGVSAHLSVAGLGAYFTRLGNPTLSRLAPEPFPIERLKLAPRELRYANLLKAQPARVRDFLREHCKGAEGPELALRVMFLLYQTGHLLADGVLHSTRMSSG